MRHRKPFKNKNLTEGTVWKVLLVFFLPIAAGTCIQQLYNAVDGMIVGRFVGTSALAAVGGSAAQIIGFLIGFFVAITAGASVVIAQIYGAGRMEDVRDASGNAITIFGILGILLAVFGILAAPFLLKLLQTPPDTMEGSLLYLRIYFTGVPFILVLNMESNMLRAVGDSFGPFIFMVVGCLTNIVLDIVFVIAFHMGISGVAFATVISQVVNMVLLTVRLMKTDEPWRLKPQDFRPGRAYLSGMFRIGVPSGLQAGMFSISNMVIQIGVNSLGTVVVASWAMTSKTDGIFWSVSNAIGAAVTSFIGQNLGAGKLDRVKKCVREGLILAFAVSFILSVLIMLAAKPLLHILTTDADVIATTYRMMTYFVPFYFTWTIIEVLSAILRGAGDTVRPFIIISLGICLFRIIWIVTVFAHFHTLLILCLSYASSWILTDVILIIYFRRGTWMQHGSVLR